MGEMALSRSSIQIVGANLIGLVVKSPHGTQYILMVSCYYTGWTEAYPLPSKSSQEVWNRLS